MFISSSKPWLAARLLCVCGCAPAVTAGALGDPAVHDKNSNPVAAMAAGQSSPVPQVEDAESRLKHLRWVGVQSERLKAGLPDWNVRREFLLTVWYESNRAALDPAVVLSLIETASNFRKFYVSESGARGYMGVSPAWVKKLGNGDAGILFNVQTNLRYGCVVLRHLLDLKRGDLVEALNSYFVENIAFQGMASSQDDFSRRVLENKTKWAYDDRTPISGASGAK
jgi:soluble lytic murein transglycosylase-like protein